MCPSTCICCRIATRFSPRRSDLIKQRISRRLAYEFAFPGFESGFPANAGGRINRCSARVGRVVDAVRRIRAAARGISNQRSHWTRPDGIADDNYVAEAEVSIDANGRILSFTLKKGAHGNCIHRANAAQGFFGKSFGAVRCTTSHGDFHRMKKRTFRKIHRDSHGSLNEEHHAAA